MFSTKPSILLNSFKLILLITLAFPKGSLQVIIKLLLGPGCFHCDALPVLSVSIFSYQFPLNQHYKNEVFIIITYTVEQIRHPTQNGPFWGSSRMSG